MAADHCPSQTGPERELLIAAEDIRSGPAWQTPAETDAAARQLLLAAEALEDEVGWHSPARFKTTAVLAHRLLAGPDATAGAQMLYEQGPAWEERLPGRSPGRCAACDAAA
ncbi:hypothetical protein [Streptomyces sp. NPDC002553]|uniref:hypothetical protein n=1 Tax=Streptomyces sp. NPDC002553 TaxID=3154417 RepID=UPI00331B4C86